MHLFADDVTLQSMLFVCEDYSAPTVIYAESNNSKRIHHNWCSCELIVKTVLGEQFWTISRNTSDACLTFWSPFSRGFSRTKNNQSTIDDV